MGRPLNKHLFGDNSLNNIKVQFHNGLNSVRGYIVRQRSNLKFLCEDEHGTQAVCKLVNKHSADLQSGEMSITVKYDDGTVRQVVKIAKNLVTVDYAGTNYVTGGVHGSDVYGQAGWSFSTSTSDHKWQIEEAGTNAAMASATDLEGDDDPNADYPVPGSGSWVNAATAFTGMTFANKGTPAAVTGGVATVANSAAGLMRTKYAGHFNDTLGGLPANWNMTFFQTTTVVRRIADTHVSWGNQTDTVSQQNFSMEFNGYVKVPVTQNYNFYCQVDDDCAVWIGSSALAPTNSNYLMQGSNQSMPNSPITNTNSLTMTAGTWYPVRIWMTEYQGGSQFQIFAQGANGSVYTGEDLTWAYDSATLGYNP
jgi:hypothetical protein